MDVSTVPEPNCARAAPPERARRLALAAGVAAALALIVQARALQCEFVSWDDELYVTDNLDVLYPTLDGVVRLFDPRSLVLRDWTPVVTLSFIGEHALFGLEPLPYHATNWLLHSAITALVVVLFGRVGAPLLLAAGAGALFAIHPFQVESVAWVSARKNLLALIFALGSLLVYVRGRSLRSYAASLLLFALALGSKATAVVVPLWILAHQVTIGAEGLGWREVGRKAFQTALRLSPFFVLALGRGLWSTHTQVEVIERTAELGLDGRLALMGPVVVTYLRQLFWPTDLSLHYIWPPLSGTDPRVLLSWGGLALLAALLTVWGRRDRRVAFAALLAVIGLLPTSNVIPAPYLQADRYTHMALVGASYLVVAAWAGVGQRLRLPPPIVVGAYAAWLVLALAPMTWSRTAVWESSCALWRDTVARAPTYGPVHNNLALCLSKEGDDEGAEQELRTALALDEGSAEAWNNLGTLLLRQKRPEEARDAFRRSVALDGRRATPQRNLAKAYHELRERARAEAHLRQAIELEPRRPVNYSALGFLLGEQGRTREAEQWLRRGLERRETAELQNNLAWLLLEDGRAAEGLEHARRAVDLGPEFAAAWDTLGTALARTGHAEEARVAFEKALELNPDLEVVQDHLEEELNPL